MVVTLYVLRGVDSVDGSDRMSPAKRMSLSVNRLIEETVQGF